MSGIYAELRSFVLAHRARGVVSIFMTALARPAPMIRSMADTATGFLHVVRLTDAVDPVMAEYRIAFAPLGGRLRIVATIQDPAPRARLPRPPQLGAGPRHPRPRPQPDHTAATP